MNLLLRREGMDFGLYLKDEKKKATLNRINTNYFINILLDQSFTDVYFKPDRPNDVIIEIGNETVTIEDYNQLKQHPQIQPIVSKINFALIKHMTAVKLKAKKLKLYKRRIDIDDIEWLTDNHTAVDENPILETPLSQIKENEKGNESEKRRAIYYYITYVGLDLGIPKKERDDFFNQHVTHLLQIDNVQETIIRLLLDKQRNLDKQRKANQMAKRNRPTIKKEIRDFQWVDYINIKDNDNQSKKI